MDRYFNDGRAEREARERREREDRLRREAWARDRVDEELRRKA